MNIIPNLPILHSKKTVGKFVFTQNYLQSLGDFKATDIPEFLHELAKITEGDFFEFATNNTEKVLEVASKYKL